MSAGTDRVAAAVVRLYPSGLRREFGDEMRQWCRARWLAASTPLAAGRLALMVVADLVRSWSHAWWQAVQIRNPGGALRLSGPDVRGAWKGLRRRPWLSLATAGILGIGLAFTIAALSIVKALLLSPYPYPSLDRLALIRDGRPADGAHQGRSLPAGDLDALSRDGRAFSGIAIWRVWSVVLGDAHGETPEAFEGLAVAPNFFSVLGATPRLGRTFALVPSGRAAADEVVISDRLWRSRFAANPAVIGTSVLVNSRPTVLIGVIPDEACYPSGVDVWLPLVLSPSERVDHGAAAYRAVARLAAGFTMRSAQADADRVGLDLARAFPATNQGRGFNVSALRAEQYEFTAAPFLLVQASALLVLLLAIVNVAGLLTAKASERAREFAVRRALGGSRLSLFGGMVVEASWLTLAAVAGGLALAWAMATAIRQLLPDGISRWFAGWSSIGLDPTVILGGLALALGTALALGSATGWQALRMATLSALNRSGRSAVATSSVSRRAMVVAQVAFAMALLVCGGMVFGGFERIARVFDGTDPHRNVIFRVTRNATSAPVALVEFHQRLHDQLSALPDVVEVGLIQNHPASNVPCPPVTVLPEGRPVPPVGGRFRADLQTVSPGALKAVGVRVLQGRAIDDRDRGGNVRVAMVSESMASSLWPSGNALGTRVQLGDESAPWTTVVGIASDLRLNWYDADRRPTVYLPYAQAPVAEAYVVVHTTGNPVALAAAARAAVHAVDPQQAIPLPRMLEDEVKDSITPVRALSFLLSGAALVAVMLAAAGLYAAIASVVVARRRELGLRLALGATPPAVGWLMLHHALRLTVVGIALGAPCAWLAAATLRRALFGVAAPSGLIVVASALALVTVAIAAASVPSTSAMRTDPASLLRSE